MASEVSDTVGARVRDLRRRRQWTVEELAERCPAGSGLTVAALYALESGRRERATGRRRRHVTVDEWIALAEAFDVEPAELLGEGHSLLHSAGLVQLIDARIRAMAG